MCRIHHVRYVFVPGGKVFAAEIQMFWAVSIAMIDAAVRGMLIEIGTKTPAYPETEHRMTGSMEL